MKIRTRILFASLVVAVMPIQAQDKPDALKTYRLGRDLEAQGRQADAMVRYDEAVAICQAEISQNATNMDSYTVLVWSLLRQKKYRDVIEWGQKALKVNSGDYRVIETIGEAYFFQAAYKDSLKAMERYVDGAPQGDRVSIAYFFMGEIYRIQKRNRHADIAYTTAVKLEPSVPLWWYRLGSVREAAGEYASAVAAYERAVALSPGYKDAVEALDRAKKRGA